MKGLPFVTGSLLQAGPPATRLPNQDPPYTSLVRNLHKFSLQQRPNHQQDIPCILCPNLTPVTSNTESNFKSSTLVEKTHQDRAAWRHTAVVDSRHSKGRLHSSGFLHATEPPPTWYSALKVLKTATGTAAHRNHRRYDVRRNHRGDNTPRDNISRHK